MTDRILHSKSPTTSSNHEQRKSYWSEFYRQQRSLVPSQFCALVASEIDACATVVDCGSGNGRDSLFFASQGHTAIAMDLSTPAVKVSNQEADRRGLGGRVMFLHGNLCYREDVENAVRIARQRGDGEALAFYSRFVLHALNEVEEERFLLALSTCMNNNERVFFEFRSKEDARRAKHYPNHFRRYLDSTAFEQKLEDKWGFSLEYSITGVGMAKYREEDPIVTRIFAKKT